MLIFFENCQKMAQNGPKWPKMVENGQKMAES